MLFILLFIIIFLWIFMAMVFKEKPSTSVEPVILKHFCFDSETPEIYEVKKLYEQDQIPLAMRKIRELIIRDGKNLYYNYVLGNILISKGETADAVKQFEMISDLMPDIIDAREKLAECYLELENYQKVISECKFILEQNVSENNFKWEQMLAIAYFEQAEYDLAIELYSKFLQKDLSNINYLDKLAELNFRGKNYSKSLDFDNKILRLDENNPDSLKRVANTYFLIEKYEESLDFFKKLSAASFNDYVKEIVKVAKCLLKLNDIRTAQKIAENLLTEDNEDVDALEILMHCCAAKNEYQQAIEYGKEIIGLSQNDKDMLKAKNNVSFILLEWGKILFETEDIQLGFDTYLEALKYNPENPEVYYSIALANQHIKDYPNAVSMLKKALAFELNPKYYLMMGYIHDENNNPYQAREAFEKVLELDEKNLEALSFLGVYYATQKKYQRAIEFFTKIIDNNPEHQDSYYNLALAYECLDNNSKAQEYYKKLLILNPGHQEAKKALML